MDPRDASHATVDLLGIELIPTWDPMPPENALKGIVSKQSPSLAMPQNLSPRSHREQSLSTDLEMPVAVDVWQHSLCQPLPLDSDAIEEISTKTVAIIPEEIISAVTQPADAVKEKSTVVPLVPDRAIAMSRGEDEEEAGRLDEADFKTELEILESLWNINFKMGMQETGEDSNRVRVGTVARYKGPGQSLKVDVDFERNQGDEERFANQFRLGTLASYRWGGKEVEFDLKYERREDEQENVTNRLLLDGTHEWFFNSTRWSHYLGGKVEYDQMQTFDSRFETNTGFAYSVLKNRYSHIKFKAGATVVREIGEERQETGLTPDSLYGVSVNQQVTTAHKISTSVDYIPQWSNLGEYEVKSQANLQVVLNEDLDLKFRVGARNRYESSMPIESIEEGTEYTTSLILVY